MKAELWLIESLTIRGKRPFKRREFDMRFYFVRHEAESRAAWYAEQGLPTRIVPFVEKKERP